MDALVAFALLLFVVLAPRAIMHACCVDAGAALAALALLLLLVLALLLLSLLLLSLWLRRLQCLGLFRLPRFPFHDSQVFQKLSSRVHASRVFAKKGPPVPAPFRETSQEPFESHFGCHFGVPGGPQERQESPRRAKRGPK